MIRTASLLLASALIVIAAEPVRPADAREIRKNTQAASTPSEHLAAANQWESRALALDTQAAKLDQEADALARRDFYNPIKHKWPAMAQAPIDRLRAKAMQARRAASESRQLVAHHRKLAVQAQAAE